ncbi:MAG: hypothetical protein WCI76_02485 [bacterium]
MKMPSISYIRFDEPKVISLLFGERIPTTYYRRFKNKISLIQTFENILSEARKYGLNLTIAHQYVGQIITKVYQAVLGNVGNVISFRVGGEDAVKLKPEFEPLFGVKDMINLAVGEIYIKMTIDGESYDPFSAETLKVLPATHPSYRQEIIDASRRKYSIPKDDANKLIAEEEATIIRSAEEKAIIEGKGKTQDNSVDDTSSTETKEPKTKTSQEAEPMI